MSADELKYRTWSIRDAKAKLSEMLEEAQDGVPQLITNHGKPHAIVFKVGSLDEIKEILEVRKVLRRRMLLDSLSAVRVAAEAEGVENLPYEREDDRPIRFVEGQG